MKTIAARSTLLMALLAACSPVEAAADAARPNVVFIMTDNHGAWTLGCYGNPDIRTPNIDRLAAEGARFTRAYSSNPVCSPTRATYLTGLIPSQHGVHCFLSGGPPQTGEGSYCTISEFKNLPKTLAAEGYVCGLSGKWHLGANMTPQEGFSSWITMPHGGTATFYDAQVIENGEIRKEPQYLTDLWTDHGVKFIEDNKDKPFFLFLAYNGPYGLGKTLVEPLRNRHAAYYTDKELPSFPREKMHPWLFHNKEYLNNPLAIRNFACELSAVDDGVGRVMETLSRLGLDENTLVVFCADQGWLGGQHGIWGMGDHTRPLGAFDGMMQVPLIFRQPKRIAAKTEVDRLVSNYDFYPTVLEYLGVDPSKNNQQSPGRSYAGMLEGKEVEWTDEVFYEMENVRAIRTSDWKYVHRHPDGPDELYDLKNDPDERTNLVGRSSDEDAQLRMKKKLETFFAKYADARYDLYKAGGAKSKLLTDPKATPLGPPK